MQILEAEKAASRFQYPKALPLIRRILPLIGNCLPINTSSRIIKLLPKTNLLLTFYQKETMTMAMLKISENLHKRQGFTLIELLITVVIIGILSAIALPAYTSYLIRGKRNAAQSQMMDLSNREQQYLLANRVYLPSTDANFPSMYTLDSTVAKYYALTSVTLGQTLNSCGVVPTNIPSFVITFTPIGNQTPDGVLTLSSDGSKCPVNKW